MSNASAVRTGFDTPENAAFNDLPGSAPPHSATSSANGVPISTSWTPGRRTSPITLAINVPGDPAVPIERNQSAPLAMMCAAAAKVSALLTTVGFDSDAIPLTGREPDSQPIGDSEANSPSS